MANRPLKKDKFSKYRGVSRNGDPSKPYRACFKYQGKNYWVGAYKTETEAAIAYNKAALSIIGEHAILNQIEEESNA